MDEETVSVEMTQINVKIRKQFAVAAKRIAAHRGVPLNTLIENQIKVLMQEDANALVEQMRAEREQSEREEREIIETLKQLELAPTD